MAERERDKNRIERLEGGGSEFKIDIKDRIGNRLLEKAGEFLPLGFFLLASDEISHNESKG
jgi:hypothetical protein